MVTEGAVIPLDKFSISPKVPVSQKGIPIKSRKPVKVRVKRGASKIPLKHVFFARLKGRTSLYSRIGKGRFPVRKAQGPAIPSMVATHSAEIESGIEKRLEKEVKSAFAALEAGTLGRRK